MQMLPGASERFKAFLPWSIPLKLILSALAGVLGGAGLLGYLTEYATYNYAIHYGIRPPLEGIPYLRAAVAFGSLFLLLSGAIVFAAIVFVLRAFAWYFDAIPRVAMSLPGLLGKNAQARELIYGNLLNSIRGRPLWQLLAACVALSALSVAAIFLLPENLLPSSDSSEKPKLMLATFLYLLALLVTVARPSSIWWISILVVIAYLLVCIYLLFSPAKYSEFLRILGYGGGLTVSVELLDSTGPTATDKLQLMLRTNEAVILYDHPNGHFLEIPNDRVHRILHDIGGMRRLPHSLPEKVNQWGDG